ncbi:MAG: hypothetical protein GY749_11210 [Desulfobacteraceae bacterium]|nr:hypothetical protein [Desulfobacteraceae bacterium]
MERYDDHYARYCPEHIASSSKCKMMRPFRFKEVVLGNDIIKTAITVREYYFLFHMVMEIRTTNAGY